MNGSAWWLARSKMNYAHAQHFPPFLSMMVGIKVPKTSMELEGYSMWRALEYWTLYLTDKSWNKYRYLTIKSMHHHSWLYPMEKLSDIYSWHTMIIIFVVVVIAWMMVAAVVYLTCTVFDVFIWMMEADCWSVSQVSKTLGLGAYWA